MAATPISKGTVISDSMLAIRSPGRGLPTTCGIIGAHHDEVLQSMTSFICPISSVTQNLPEIIRSKIVWIAGEVSRMDTIIKNTNLDFVEFHLSYKDLELNPGGIH